MSAHCQVTGRKPGFGMKVSHSHQRTRRRWNPNIQKKTYWLPSENRRVTLTLSTKASRRWTAVASSPSCRSCVPAG